MLIDLFLKLASRQSGKNTASEQVRVDGNWIDLRSAIEAIRQCWNIAELLPFLSHYSGYIREAAVTQGAMLKDASIIGPLIDRLNDWVPQVRLAAQNALRANLVSENVPHLVTLLPEFAKLQNRGRDKHALLLADIEQFIKRPEHISAVVDGLSSADSKVVRACYRLLLDSDAVAKTELAYFGLRSKDLLVAVEAIRLLDALREPDRLHGVEIGLRSPFSSLRSTMLLALLRSTSEKKIPVAISMLFDRQQTVREIACGWLAEQGDQVSKHYLDVLEDSAQPVYKIRCALWALVKFQLREALPIAQRLTGSPSPKVRAAAILSCAKLDPENVGKLLEVALTDEWPGTNKVAIQLTRLSGEKVTYPLLQRLLLVPERVQVALQISRSNGKWEWLLTLLDTILIWRNKNEGLVQLAMQDLQEWIRLDSGNFTSPARAYVDLLKVQVQGRVLEDLNPGCRERLAFILECVGVPSPP